MACRDKIDAFFSRDALDRFTCLACEKGIAAARNCFYQISLTATCHNTQAAHRLRPKVIHKRLAPYFPPDPLNKLRKEQTFRGCANCADGHTPRPAQLNALNRKAQAIQP